jgi:hypothetical protein
MNFVYPLTYQGATSVNSCQFVCVTELHFPTIAKSNSARVWWLKIVAISTQDLRKLIYENVNLHARRMGDSTKSSLSNRTVTPMIGPILYRNNNLIAYNIYSFYTVIISSMLKFNVIV